VPSDKLDCIFHLQQKLNEKQDIELCDNNDKNIMLNKAVLDFTCNIKVLISLGFNAQDFFDKFCEENRRNINL